MAHNPASVKTLKVFSRQYPDVQDLLFIIGFEGSEPEEQTDRTVAIVAGALIDMFLELAIRTRLITTLDPNDGNQLFVGNGPLSTMSARIKIAHALGLFSDPVRDELDHIREIRNAFSHTVGKIMFDMPEVANVCERLILPGAYPPDDPKMVRTPRQKFTLSVRVCWMLISESLSWRTDLVMVDPFLARVGRMHPELMPWLGKSRSQNHTDPRTDRHGKKKTKRQRPTSRQ